MRSPGKTLQHRSQGQPARLNEGLGFLMWGRLAELLSAGFA